MNTLLIAAVLLFGLDDAPVKGLRGKPVALVLSVKGQVFAKGRLPQRLVNEGDYLLPGEEVWAAKDAEVLLAFLVKGGQGRLVAGQRTTLTRDGWRPANAVMIVGKAKLPAKNRTKAREIQVGEGGAIFVARTEEVRPGPRITPIYGTFVAQTRPSFSWPRIDKAEQYVLELKQDGFGPDRRGRKFATKDNTPRLDYPAGEKPLQLGQKYVWTVKAKLPGGDEKVVVEESHFTTLLEGEPEELESVEKLARSKDPADLLLAAATYRGYGVLDRSIQVFERLTQKRPKVARYWVTLAGYYRRAGQLDKVKEATEKAKKLSIPVGK